MVNPLISDLTGNTAPAGEDLIALVTDPLGNPASRACALRYLRAHSNMRVLLDTGVNITDTGTSHASQGVGDGWEFSTAGWDDYPILDIYGWAQSTNDSNAMWFDLSEDTGESYTGYGENAVRRSYLGRTSNAGNDVAHNNTDDLLNIHPDLGNAADEYAAFRVTLFMWNDNLPTHAFYELSASNPSDYTLAGAGGAIWDASGRVTNVAIFAGQGELDTGKLIVVGVGGTL